MDPEKKLTQLEYDVTNYRNLLDRLQTVEGVVNDAVPYFKAQLALSLTPLVSHTDRRAMSGYMMKVKGGKSERRWGEVVSKEIGLGALAHTGGFARKIDDKIKAWTGVHLKWHRPPRRTKNNMHRVDRMSGWEKTYSIPPPSFIRNIQNRVYDAMNIFRGVNLELNKLRVEMPFDLRQLMNQLNNYAGSLPNGDKAHQFIYTYKIFVEWKKLQKSVIPKMRQKITERIKKAELEKKVAAETIRKENEATITKEEKIAREKEPATTSVQQQFTTMPVKSKITQDDRARVKQLITALEKKVQAENDQLIAEKEGKAAPDKTGAGLTAGAIALLLMLGAG